jgi:hypothetical protein
MMGTDFTNYSNSIIAISAIYLMCKITNDTTLVDSFILKYFGEGNNVK